MLREQDKHGEGEAGGGEEDEKHEEEGRRK